MNKFYILLIVFFVMFSANAANLDCGNAQYQDQHLKKYCDAENNIMADAQQKLLAVFLANLEETPAVQRNNLFNSQSTTVHEQPKSETVQPKIQSLAPPPTTNSSAPTTNLPPKSIYN